MALIGIYFIINLIGRQTILYDVPSRSRYLMNQCYFNSRKKLRICISITRKVKVKVEEKVSAWCFLYSHFSQRRLRYWPLHYLWSPWFLSNKKINSAFSVGRKKLKVPSQQSTEMIKSFDKLDWCETATWNPDESASQEWNKVKRLLKKSLQKHLGIRNPQNLTGFRTISISNLFWIPSIRLLFIIVWNPATSLNKSCLKPVLQRNTRYFANVYWLELYKSMRRTLLLFIQALDTSPEPSQTVALGIRWHCNKWCKSSNSSLGRALDRAPF